MDWDLVGQFVRKSTTFDCLLSSNFLSNFFYFFDKKKPPHKREATLKNKFTDYLMAEKNQKSNQIEKIKNRHLPYNNQFFSLNCISYFDIHEVESIW
jgi:predicted transglutaminase-like protease